MRLRQNYSKEGSSQICCLIDCCELWRPEARWMYAQSLPRNPLKAKSLLIPKRNHNIAEEVKGTQHAHPSLRQTFSSIWSVCSTALITFNSITSGVTSYSHNWKISSTDYIYLWASVIINQEKLLKHFNFISSQSNSLIIKLTKNWSLSEKITVVCFTSTPAKKVSRSSLRGTVLQRSIPYA